MPIELLYTKSIQQEETTDCREETKRDILAESNVPLIAVKDVNAFFELFTSGVGDATRYFENYAALGRRDVAACIDDRVKTYGIWKEELRKGMEYFQDAAAMVEWNVKGYFNVIDGVHRSLFLYHTGIYSIPVRYRCFVYILLLSSHSVMSESL